MSGYRLLAEHRFATGEPIRPGDLFRDNDNSPIRDTYQVKEIRDFGPSGIHVVLTIIRREHDGQATEPMTETMCPIWALFDFGEPLVRVTEAGEQR